MIEDYIRAKRIGDRDCRRAIAHGKYPFLLALEDMVADLDSLSEEKIGVFDIHFSQIAGTKTKGRQNAFSNTFFPVLSSDSEFAMKWAKLHDSMLEDGMRDAIKVYEYLMRFYVEEGNKRVSVSRFLDMPFVPGDVIRILPKRNGDRSVEIYYEFLEFFRCVPTYEFEFSQLGSYRKLASYFGKTLDEPWDEESRTALITSFRAFRKMFSQKGGEQQRTTPADAYLIYLKIYGAEPVSSIGEKLLDQRMKKLWGEFAIGAGKDNLIVAENPLEHAPENLMDKMGKTLEGFIKGSYSPSHPLRAAFLYEKGKEESSWTYAHEIGRSFVQQSFDGCVETMAYPAAGDGEKLRILIDDAALNGANVIFTTAPGQMDVTLKSAIHYPKVHFLNCSVNLSRGAVRTYYGRMYEAKFILGALAASLSEGHAIGYMAPRISRGVVSDINAFAIGASMIDPACKIHLSWVEEEPEDHWRERMIRMGVTMLSSPNNFRLATSARSFGLYGADPDGRVRNIAAPVWDWGHYYQQILSYYLDGSFEKQQGKNKALGFFWGFSAGVIDVVLSSKLAYTSQKMVWGLKRAITSGDFHPFSGEIWSQDGKVKDAASPRLSSEEIMAMDWLNENIIGELPAIKEEA